MDVQVLFFAAYREAAGEGEVRVSVPAGATVGDLVSHLRQPPGTFRFLPEVPVVAVNRRYADAGQPLAEGDEVAFIPPVAGG